MTAVPALQPLYLIIVGGISLFLLLVFQLLLGLRVIKLKGALHGKVHRWAGITLVVFAVLHGIGALGTVVFGWF